MFRKGFGRASFTLLATALAVGVGTYVSAFQPAAAGSVGTADQLEAGRTAYRTHCAGCHASTSRACRPRGAKPSADEYVTIVVFILERNGAAIGQAALTATTATAIGTVATGMPPKP